MVGEGKVGREGILGHLRGEGKQRERMCVFVDEDKDNAG